MKDLKLTWRDEHDPRRHSPDFIRAEYDLPAPYNGIGSAKVVATISRDQFAEEGSESCQLVLAQDRGPGFWTMTYPDVETAKKTAVRWVKKLVRRTTEPAEAAE